MSKEEAQKPPKQALALVSNKQSDLDALEPRGAGIFANSKYGPLHISRNYKGNLEAEFSETIDLGAMLVAMEYISDASELGDDPYESPLINQSDVLGFVSEFYGGAQFIFSDENECIDDGVYKLKLMVECDPEAKTFADVTERVGSSVTKIREKTPEEFGQKYNAREIYG